MTEAELRKACEAGAPCGCAKSAAVLRVLAELDAVRERAKAVLARPWQGTHTTHAKEAVREVLGEVRA